MTQPNVIPMPTAGSEYRLLKATVKAVTGGAIVLDTDQGVVTADKAFACLVEPTAGDVVLVSQSGREHYVLTVLARPHGADMSLQFPGDVSLSAPDGHMNLLSGDAINLTSVKTSLTSADLQLRTGKLTTDADEISVRTRRARFFADALDSVVTRLSQRAENVMRWVEGVETLRLGTLIQTVRRSYTSHSQQAVITAAQDMRIDGERIHMG